MRLGMFDNCWRDTQNLRKRLLLLLNSVREHRHIKGMEYRQRMSFDELPYAHQLE